MVSRGIRSLPGATAAVSSAGYWLATAGRYYLQLQQIGDAGHMLYSPVETITVR